MSSNPAIAVGDFCKVILVCLYERPVSRRLQGQALSAEWIAAAHDAGFEVHGWTFRPTTLEAAFSLTQPFIDMRMDGFFTDFPDLTRQVIQSNQIAVIPLPASGLLLIGGLGVLLALRRRRH
jgi:glycerophosphoryl diester phosphodiesterase